MTNNYTIYQTANQYGYGWSLVSGSHPANFICEIDELDVTIDAIIRRDYGKIKL